MFQGALVVATHDLALAALAGRAFHLVDGRLAPAAGSGRPEREPVRGEPFDKLRTGPAEPPTDQMFHRPQI